MMATRRRAGLVTVPVAMAALRLLRRRGGPDRDGLSRLAAWHGMSVAALLDAVDDAWPSGRVGERWRWVL